MSMMWVEVDESSRSMTLDVTSSRDRKANVKQELMTFYLRICNFTLESLHYRSIDIDSGVVRDALSTRSASTNDDGIALQ